MAVFRVEKTRNYTYEKAEQAGYYRVAGAEPRSVVVLKQPLGGIPAGKRLLWVCGDRGFRSMGGVFGGELKCRAKIRVIPIEEVLDPDDRRLEGLDFESAAPRKMPICAGTVWRTTRTG